MAHKLHFSLSIDADILCTTSNPRRVAFIASPRKRPLRRGSEGAMLAGKGGVTCDFILTAGELNTVVIVREVPPRNIF